LYFKKLIYLKIQPSGMDCRISRCLLLIDAGTSAFSVDIMESVNNENKINHRQTISTKNWKTVKPEQ